MEIWAGDCIASALGSGFGSRHVGEEGEHDCTILFDGTEFAYVEVTEDGDPDLQQAMAFSAKYPDEVVFELAPGTGMWACELDPSVRMRGAALHDVAIRLINELTDQGRDTCDAEFNPLHPNSSEAMSGAGIRSILKAGDSEDRLYFHYQRAVGGTLLRSDQDVLRDYVFDRLGDGRIAEKVGRLVARSVGRTAWLVIVVSSATPTSVIMRMLGESFNPGLPNEGIPLPEGLDGVWIAAPRTSSALVWFTRNGGWSSWSDASIQQERQGGSTSS